MARAAGDKMKINCAMTKDEFDSKRNALNRYGFIMALLWVAGFGFFILWPYFATGKMDMHWTSPLFQTCFVIYFLGGPILMLWLGIRWQKRFGAVCPKCGKLFLSNKISAKNVRDTGKCIHCGETIISE
jgi:hypothetical protein